MAPYIVNHAALLTVDRADFARTCLSILKLDKPSELYDSDPVQAEMTRRLVATIALMDHLMLPFLDIKRPATQISPLPRLFSHQEFDTLRSRSANAPTTPTGPNLMQELLDLSSIYLDICKSGKESPVEVHFTAASNLRKWYGDLPAELDFTDANFDSHRTQFMLRPFTFLHVLFHHSWHLILLDKLPWTDELFMPGAGRLSLDPDIVELYDHAAWIADTVVKLWNAAHLDLHNSCFGLSIVVAQTVLVHRLLSLSDRTQKEATQAQVKGLRNCLIRVKEHCRLFDWVVSLPSPTSYGQALYDQALTY